MSVISFDGLHVIAGDVEELGWFMRGKFTFEDEDDFEEFKTGIQSAFELLQGYPIPTILTQSEYEAMHQLPIIAISIPHDDL